MQDDRVMFEEGVFDGIADLAKMSLALWILRKWEAWHRLKTLSESGVRYILTATKPHAPFTDVTSEQLREALDYLLHVKCIELVDVERFRLTQLGANIGHAMHPVSSAHS